MTWGAIFEFKRSGPDRVWGSERSRVWEFKGVEFTSLARDGLSGPPGKIPEARFGFGHADIAANQGPLHSYFHSPSFFESVLAWVSTPRFADLHSAGRELGEEPRNYRPPGRMYRPFPTTPGRSRGVNKIPMRSPLDGAIFQRKPREAVSNPSSPASHPPATDTPGRAIRSCSPQKRRPKWRLEAGP